MEEEGESRVYDYRCTKGGRGEDKRARRNTARGNKVSGWMSGDSAGVEEEDGGREKLLASLIYSCHGWTANSGHMGPGASKTGSHDS